MSTLINSNVEPWKVHVPSIGSITIASDGTVAVLDSVDASAARILNEHVGAPLAAWRRGRWLINAGLMRAPSGETVLFHAQLESWYPAFAALMDNGWQCLADRLVEIAVINGEVRACSQRTGATVTRHMAANRSWPIVHDGRPGSNTVELQAPPRIELVPVDALVLVDSRFPQEVEVGVERARTIRSLLAMPELRGAQEFAEVISTLSALSFLRLPSIFSPEAGDERDIDTRSSDAVTAIESWLPGTTS